MAALQLQPPRVAATAAGEGRSIGAVYMAVLVLLGAVVPITELPPAIPLTSHVMVAPAARQNDPLNVCVCASETVAAGGEMAFVAEHVMVTLAVANFVGSASS